MYEYGTLNPVKVILEGRGRIMEWMNYIYNICIYGNVTAKPPVQLSYTNKNIFKRPTSSVLSIVKISSE
jgi:hypothetical protein